MPRCALCGYNRRVWKGPKVTPEIRKNFMIEYLKVKVEEQDWHGVADAAMDLREIEIELKLNKEFKPPVVYQNRLFYSELSDPMKFDFPPNAKFTRRKKK